MKKWLPLLLCLIVCICDGATWTVHTTRDYCASFNTAGPNGYWGGAWTVQWTAGAYWDYWNDTTYPEYAYSGTWFYDAATDEWTTTINYVDTQIIEVPDTQVSQVYFGISSPGPDYFGWSDVYDFNGEFVVGEYWLDIFSGTIRISASQPSDFGKWAWDGSINPNWVEPLASVSFPGKHLAKGHAK